MAVYGDLADIVTSIFKKLGESTDFLRLVSNDEPDALDVAPKNTLSELMNSSDINPARLVPLPFTSEPTQDKGTYMHIYYVNGSFAGANNVYQHDIVFNVVLYSHVESWQLTPSGTKNRIRPYELLDIIESTISSMDVPQAIRGKFVVTPPRYVGLRNEFCGYDFSIKITGSSSKMCN